MLLHNEKLIEEKMETFEMQRTLSCCMFKAKTNKFYWFVLWMATSKTIMKRNWQNKLTHAKNGKLKDYPFKPLSVSTWSNGSTS